MEDMLFSKKIAEVLQFHRSRAGLNRQDLASLAGVGKTAIYDLEHAKPSVQLDTLLKILKALNIRLALESPLMAAFEKEQHEKG